MMKDYRNAGALATPAAPVLDAPIAGGNP